jgi:glutamyl-tRNA reductase
MVAVDSPALLPLVVGANHRSSALAVRDRLIVDTAEVPSILAELRAAGVAQSLVVSTCDRIDVVAAHADADVAAALIAAVLATHADLPAEEVAEHLYVMTDAAALRHLFGVVATLDSVVPGDPHLLGQIRAAYAAARRAATTGDALDAMMRSAFTAARRVRAETTIAEGPVSMVAAAVDITRELFGRRARVSVLMIGSGAMGEFLVDGLAAAGIGGLAIAHPDPSRAERLARRFDGHVAAFSPLTPALAAADVVVSGLGGRSQVVTRDVVRAALKLRRDRPIFLIDAALPGDIDAAVDRLDSAFRYTLDDLESAARRGQQFRRQDIDRARRIIDDEVERFLLERAERSAAPLVAALHRHFETVRGTALADSGGDADKATRLLVGRLLHGPTSVLKALAAGAGHGEDWQTLRAALERLFGLGADGEDGKR